MMKNFTIKDGVVFDFLSESLDIREHCELLSTTFIPGLSSRVEMNWRLNNSNQQVQINFTSVEDFIVKGRDLEYPLQSGVVLKIAGFNSGLSDLDESQFYVEPTVEMDYMSFVMADKSIFLVKARSSIIRRV